MAINETAIVSRKAELGENVTIGPYSIVHDRVVLAADCVIGSHCIIGYPTPLAEGQPLIIGRNALIRSHSTFYEGSILGDDLVTGHGVVVREKVRAGTNLQIGTFGDLQGDTEIGDYVRLHSNVFIGKFARLGNFVWIFPYVVLTNDPHPPSNVMIGVRIEDFAVLATSSVVLPGVTVGSQSLVAAHSLVNRDVSPGTVVAGVPAKKLCEIQAIKLKDGSGRPAYPWIHHFHRGYPQSVIDGWISSRVHNQESG
jgi:acetyltransferase-like isoleucine patch superfamily enzyme